MAAPTTASSVSAFVSSIGVNIHTGFWDTSYGLADASGTDVAKILASLSYLGIGSVRDGILYSFEEPALQAIGAAGIKLDLVFFIGPNGQTLTEQFAEWESLAPYVRSIEGPNEADRFVVTYNGQTGTPATKAVQTDIYALVHSSTALAGVPVIEMSLGFYGSYGQFAGLGQADYGNTHSYFYIYDVPITQQIPLQVDHEAEIAPGLPTITTETGWQSGSTATDTSVVDQPTQAKLTLDVLLDEFKAGVAATYIYELYDISKIDDFYGLFTDDGTPKLVATALHNLTTILHDDGTATPAVQTLTYSVTNLPTTAQTLLLQKSTGTFELALWNEAQIWNSTTQTEVVVAPVLTTVQLGGIYNSVALYDPLLQTTPLLRWSDVSTVTFALPDHPVILEISAAFTPITVSSVSPATSVATGPLYRFFDTNTGTHFFTADATEELGLITAGSATYRPDLVLEASTFGTVTPATDGSTVAVARLFDSTTGTHFFTSSATELAGLIQPGSATYRPDLVLETTAAFYAHATAAAGDVAVYRFFDQSNGTHFFTGSASESQALSTAGTASYNPQMVAEGVAFYAPAMS